MYTSELMVWTTQHNVYQNQPFCIPKTVVMIFQLKG